MGQQLTEQDVERIVDRIVSKRVSKWADPKFISRNPPDANQVWQWSADENAFLPATLSGTSSGHTIRENDTAQTSRGYLNFVDSAAGAGLITDDSANDETEVNLSLYRLEAEDHSHQTTGAQAGQLDHGAAMVAASLLDDDHTQYVLEAAHASPSYDAGHHAAVTIGADAEHSLAGQVLSGVASSATQVGHVELATAAETTTGTDAARAVTPDGLAGSDFGKRLMYVKVIADDTALTTGDGKVTITIPQELTGMNLVGAHAAVYTVSSSGTPTIQIHNLTDVQDMLSTLITIDANEFSSYTALAPPVINAALDDVVTGDRLRIDVDVAGTGTAGLDVILSFQLP